MGFALAENWNMPARSPSAFEASVKRMEIVYSPSTTPSVSNVPLRAVLFVSFTALEFGRIVKLPPEAEAPAIVKSVPNSAKPMKE